MNTTIRNNIIFGNDFAFDKYEKILELCELKHELSELKDGDATHIKTIGGVLTRGSK